MAAVTSGDNSNVLVARVARETFGVERVVARIYDPRRAAIYQRLGITTVATVAWTTDQVLAPPPARPDRRRVDRSDGQGVRDRAPDHPTRGPDTRSTELEEALGARVVAVSRMRRGAGAERPHRRPGGRPAVRRRRARRLDAFDAALQRSDADEGWH